MTSARDDRDGLDEAFRLLVGHPPEREDIRLAAALNDLVQRTNLDPYVVEWIAGRASAEQSKVQMRQIADRLASDLPSPRERVKIFCNTLAYSEAVQALIDLARPWVALLLFIGCVVSVIGSVAITYSAGKIILKDCSTVASYTQRHRPHVKGNPLGMPFGLALESNLCKPFTP